MPETSRRCAWTGALAAALAVAASAMAVGAVAPAGAATPEQLASELTANDAALRQAVSIYAKLIARDPDAMAILYCWGP